MAAVPEVELRGALGSGGKAGPSGRAGKEGVQAIRQGVVFEVGHAEHARLAASST